MTEPTYTIDLFDERNGVLELSKETGLFFRNEDDPTETWKVTAPQLLERLANLSSNGHVPLSLDQLQSFLDQGMNMVVLYVDDEGNERVGLSSSNQTTH